MFLLSLFLYVKKQTKKQKNIWITYVNYHIQLGISVEK